MAWLGQLRETWDSDAMEPIDFIPVAMIVKLRWRGVVQGAEPNMEFTGVYTVRKGKIVFAELFWNHAEALEAVGLSGRSAPFRTRSALRTNALAHVLCYPCLAHDASVLLPRQRGQTGR